MLAGARLEVPGGLLTWVGGRWVLAGWLMPTGAYGGTPQPTRRGGSGMLAPRGSGFCIFLAETEFVEGRRGRVVGCAAACQGSLRQHGSVLEDSEGCPHEPATTLAKDHR